MPSGALKSFVQAIHSAPATGRAPALLPIFLVPATLGPRFPLADQPRKRKPPALRHFASVNGSNVPQSDAAKDLGRRPQIPHEGVQDHLLSRRQRDPEAWTALLDRYLPHALRIAGQHPTSGSEREDPLPIEAVHLVLANARKAAKVDLLSYIGVYQERWETVFWLVKAMVEGCPPFSVLKSHTERLPDILWDTHSRSLDDITNGNIQIADLEPSNVRLNRFLSGGLLGRGQTSVSNPRQILGQLWQGLGCMILQAEDRSASNPNREIIMSHVLQILAHLHHMSAFPDSIYNYDAARDKTVLQRPPTLHFLSARIMTALSDVAWKSYWIGEMETAESYGYNLPPPRVQPQMRRVGAEVWLDLVLWTCIEGGWITEAAWLVAEIERRRPNPELQWSVISWDGICNAKKRELDWTAILKLEIDRSRLNQATGIVIANRGTSNVNIEMGTRTVSREVVLAIMDGLVNTTNIDNHLYGNNVMQVQNYLSSCKSLLERGQPDVDPGDLNALILRAMESSAIDTRLQSGHLQRLLALVPSTAQSRDSSRSPGSLISSNMLDFSAAVLGLLHRNLDSFARQANLHGSLQAIKLIQHVIDANRDTYIHEFADELRERLLQGSKNLDTVEIHERRSTPILYPEIPPYVVEAFLDLIVESKTFELGKWLLSNDDIDGGIITSNLFSESSLQPALLRFATATANDHLLMRVLENLKPPLSRSILHALLGCQVALNKWEAVEGILKHFRDTDGMVWTTVDAMSIAAAILVLEWKGGEVHAAQLLQAKAILQDLVRGEFNSPRNQAQVPELQELRRANQLGRIFQSVAGTLSTIDLGPKGYLGRASYSTIIPSNAFKILLDSVIEYHGPLVGIKLWEQWCLDPSHSGRSEQAMVFSVEGGGERVVQPTPSMLRSILSPVIQDLKDTVRSVTTTSETRNTRESHEEDTMESSSSIVREHIDTCLREFPTISKDSLSAFDWGMNMYKKFGFSDGEIHAKIPASLRRIRKRE